jgi:hypothetical protein
VFTTLHLNGISIYLCCIQYLTIELDFCSKYQISYTAYVLLFSVKGGSELLIPSASQLFQGSSQIIMIIATTRMHRSLVNFAAGSSHVYDTFQFLSLIPLSAAGLVLGYMGAPKLAISHPLRPSGRIPHRLHWIGLR